MISFAKILIVSLCLKYLVKSSKWRVELDVWGFAFLPVPEEIVYSFLVYFGIAQIWPMFDSLDKWVWFTITFLLLKESLTLLQTCFFYYTFNSFAPFGAIEERVKYFDFKYFNENCTDSWLFEKLDAFSYSFKTTCILLRQVISLK